LPPSAREEDKRGRLEKESLVENVRREEDRPFTEVERLSVTELELQRRVGSAKTFVEYHSWPVRDLKSWIAGGDVRHSVLVRWSSFQFVIQYRVVLVWSMQLSSSRIVH
jgi:hypothetical protein